MTFRPRDFLEFAFKIYSDPNLQTPAGVRTAVSRCYYAALLTAISSLERSGVTLNRGDGVHKDVARILLSKKPTVGRRVLSDDLADMNELRIAADLDAESQVGIDVLVNAHTLAKIFSTDIDRTFNP